MAHCFRHVLGHAYDGNASLRIQVKLLHGARQILEGVDLLVHGRAKNLAIERRSGVAPFHRLVVDMVEGDLPNRQVRGVVAYFLLELPPRAHVHALPREGGEAGRENGAAEQVADDVHAHAIRDVFYFFVEGLHIVAGREAIEDLLVDGLDAEFLEVLPAGRVARAEESAVSLCFSEHEEELRDAAAETENVQAGDFFARHFDVEDVASATPEVIGRRRAQWQGGNLPKAESALEGRFDELPLTDHRFFPIPPDRLRLIIGPNSQRVAVHVWFPVAVGDDDVARLETGNPFSNFKHLGERAVSGVDLPVSDLDDVYRIGERGVVHVVLRGDRQDAKVNITPPQRGKLEFIQLDDSRNVEFGKVAIHPFPLFRYRFCRNRVGSNLFHDRPPFGIGRRNETP